MIHLMVLQWTLRFNVLIDRAIEIGAGIEHENAQYWTTWWPDLFYWLAVLLMRLNRKDEADRYFQLTLQYAQEQSMQSNAQRYLQFGDPLVRLMNHNEVSGK